MITRRQILSLAAAGPALAAPGWRDRVRKYLGTLARPDGGYAWGPDVDSHLTPTFYVVGAYKLIDSDPPNAKALAEWIRTHNPMPERRHVDRPLRRFRFEQIQGMKWLGADPAPAFRDEVAKYTGPSEFTRNYEFGGNPVFQQEIASLTCRDLLGLPATPQWKDYILARRRADGTFNNTPAADGSGGHVMNTRWGIEGLRVLGVEPQDKQKTIEWVRACQLPEGGFTWAPKAPLGGADDVAYTWAAIAVLLLLGGRPADGEGAARYLARLWNEDGGFGDRPGRESNPGATWYALSALRALRAEPEEPRPAKAPRSFSKGLRVFTIQIEAPGQGSPVEAVEMARSLGIHLWAAKNGKPGWIERAQQIAEARKVPVRFCTGNEEYGNYVSVAGLGTYSHLADLMAPAGVNFGAPMTDPKSPVPWATFRDRRIAALRKAGGRMVWQFNENEELTRALLDEAVEQGTYAAISTYHFGNENFQHTQPFLMRYHNVLPFVSLQDAHARESWWWGDQLEGFRTIFVAREPTWEGWLEALEQKMVMAICRDARTRFDTRFAGGDAALRALVAPWWDKVHERLTRPPALITALRPGDPFEEAAPAAGVLVRVRLRRRNTPQGAPAEPVTELVDLTIDGRPATAKLVERQGANGRLSDVYYAVQVESASTAAARVRNIATGKMVEVRASL